MSAKVEVQVGLNGATEVLSFRQYHGMPVSIRLEKIRSKELRFFRDGVEIPTREGIRALNLPIRERLGS